MAYESVRFARGTSGLSASSPWIAAFGFGLLHGFGFAGALAQIGLPEHARVVALLLFNLGVEIGQVGVVALLLAPLLWLRKSATAHARARVAGGYVLGGAGAFWFIQRLAAALFTG